MTKKQSPQLKLASKAYAAKHKKANPGPGYAWPMGIWFSLFFIVPLIIIVSYSFMKRDIYGGVLKQFSFDAYKQMFSKTYGLIFIRTLWITFVSTLITILIALPCGYAMARSKHQTLLLILVIVPFLTNSLIRIFAWMTILGDNGILNSILEKISYFWNIIICKNGKAFVPHKFMYTNFAVILVSIYMYRSFKRFRCNKTSINDKDSYTWCKKRNCKCNNLYIHSYFRNIHGSSTRWR